MEDCSIKYDKTPWTIPKEWVWVKMGDICNVVGGSTPDTKDASNYEQGDIAWITPADLSGYREKYISRGARNITSKGLRSCSAQILKTGAILFSSRAPIGYVAIASNPLTTNQGFKSFVPPNGLSSNYLYYYLRHAKQLAIDLSSGTTFREISGQKAALIPLALPPLPEQHRIVAKIEELFSELDKGVESLKTAQEQLKIYRQAVLQRAFEGKLTEEWRRAQKDLPNREDLLKLVKIEHAKKMIELGKKAVAFPRFSSEEINDFAEIPETWTWTRLGSVIDTCLGKMLDANKNKGTLKPYLGNANVRWGYFDISVLKSMKFLNNEDHRYGVRQGDLIVCEGGEPGRCAIWTTKNPEIMIQKALHRVRCDDTVNNKVLYYFLLYSSLTGHLNNYFTGTTIKHLPSEKLILIPIPLCSLTEQHQIVAEIESRLSVCDKLEESIAQSLLQAEALRQSILKKAFEGKLVPQDPQDEPAEKLLARIRAERLQAQPTQKVAKGRKKQ